MGSKIAEYKNQQVLEKFQDTQLSSFQASIPA